LLAVCAALAPGLWSAAVASEAPGAFKVIVNASNPATSVNRDFLAAVFLKKATRWEDGERARPVDLAADSTVRAAFSLRVLARPVAAVRNYWEQRIFSGTDVPPPELASDAEVVRYVEANPGAVGYISAGAASGAAKVLAVR